MIYLKNIANIDPNIKSAMLDSGHNPTIPNYLAQQMCNAPKNRIYLHVVLYIKH